MGDAHRIDRDELLARVDLEAVLDAVTPSSGSGPRRRWRCPSPSHEDVHPSVTISTDQHGVQRWRCWSGGEGGTAIDAVMSARSMPVGDAIRWLAEHYTHLDILPRQPPPRHRPIGRPAAEAGEYVERCEKLLWSGSGRRVRDWLHARGLHDDVLRANRVGADPGRRFLPRVKGLPAGWPAAVFPALDRNGAIAYFQARFLEPPKGRGKYDNPSRTWASNPRVAWTQMPARTARHPGVLLAAEGIPDALIAAQAGFTSVGILGSTYPDARVADEITSHTRRNDAATVAVCFDNDPSGSGAKGAARLRDLLEERSVDVRVIAPPEGLDLNDWAATDPTWTNSLDGIGAGLRPAQQASRLPDADVSIDLSL